MDNSLPGSSVYGILQERKLEWVAIPFSRGSSWLGDQTWVSCFAGWFFTIWATRKAFAYSGSTYKLESKAKNVFEFCMQNIELKNILSVGQYGDLELELIVTREMWEST